ncbi:MAG: RagB/SusD family nutrient uptake outer membrane protein [Microscillaceae bacterium]|nr:RagB/SusD family nutrient uptake outer membrane protein [Microscillaceae bacterium]
MLEINPRASLSPSTVTGADAEKLLLGVYDGLQAGGTNFYYLSYLAEDLSADNLTYRATFFQHGEINSNAILVNNVLTARYYNGPYAAIRRANDLINIVEPLPDTQFNPTSRKNEILGAARYLRAYAYYKLVTLFGGVPITLTASTDNIPRNTEAEVWAQIIEDLTFAAANAANATDRNFVSRNGAKALLARVYLIRKNWTQAATLAEEIISSNSYQLTSNYAGIWTSGNSPEVIFQIRNTLNEGAASHGFFLTEPAWTNGGRFELPVDPTLVSAYEAGDRRRDGSIAPATAFSGQFQVIKFPSGLNTSDPFYISRLAEMYLISAEAAAERDNNPASGLARLNEVRAIRGVTATSLPARATTSMDEFRDFIQFERRVELAFEGVRWTDLKRTDKAIDVLPNVTDANQLLYPIPQAAIDINPLLTQNPGY